MSSAGLCKPDFQFSNNTCHYSIPPESQHTCNITHLISCSLIAAPSEKDERPTQWQVWGYGLLFVLLVSLSSAVGVFFLPLMKRDYYKKVLMGMVGLAVGCLCGSAVLHLIPQAYGLDPKTEHAFLYPALVVIGAIYAFFLTERLLKLSVDHRKRMKKRNKRQLMAINGANEQSSPGNVEGETREFVVNSGNSCGHHHHGHHQGHPQKKPQPASPQHTDNQLSDDSFDESHSAHCGGHLHVKAPPPEVRTHQHDHDVDARDVKEHPIKTVAWMVITGDGIHNFVDGLSMGAAFSKSVLEGIAVSVAVLCEELPHELGDLAILLNSGMSLKKALLYNFISACTCFAGLFVGIQLGNLDQATTWIFAIAGGMFLYISLVDMLPEMTHTAEEASSVSIREGLIMLLIQNIGMICGFGIMFLMARYGGELEQRVNTQVS
ncbi:metal cation symporter ZIP14-like [Paramacrobiotus metropolitanus]|uniref:metal cation symporter ZIP14-like n=1 Tax=Paramacrobiotus metropolitanus TaxID=2943436 RepID=UPI002446558F|nr:metal cation symporter ZIP14-like [Paramacrobiotus metropolitanus]